MEAKPVWRLDWDESLSMDIPEIDAEHKHFIMLVNQLNEAIIDRMDTEEVNKCMRAILDDAASHFAHEEILFRQWDYPDTEEHASRHAEILSVLQDIMNEFERKKTGYDCIDAGLKIKQALIQHLLTEDMKYRDYCRKNNLSNISC